MANTVDAYREAKTTYLKLRDQAKKDLLVQFHQLASQLFQIQRELQEDFGVKVPIPSKPKGRLPKATAAGSKYPASSKQIETKAPETKVATSPAITAIEKRLVLQQRKLEEAGRAGKGTQTIKDRIYELEDELRLARNA